MGDSEKDEDPARIDKADAQFSDAGSKDNASASHSDTNSKT
jgi:hypothetical protein